MKAKLMKESRGDTSLLDDNSQREDLKECMVTCFAALTEKLEEARLEFAQNDEAIHGLVEVIGNEPKLSTLQLAAFGLLRSMGRAKLAIKKVLSEKFEEQKVKFVQRISQQLLITSEKPEETALARKMRHMVVRVINNFGLDFKQFVYEEKVLEKLVEIIRSDTSSKTERRDAIIAIKNLNFETSSAERIEMERTISCNMLLELLRTEEDLRDQLLLIIK